MPRQASPCPLPSPGACGPAVSPSCWPLFWRWPQPQAAAARPATTRTPTAAVPAASRCTAATWSSTARPIPNRWTPPRCSTTSRSGSSSRSIRCCTRSRRTARASCLSLATSYTLSPDKKTYTFTLRKGVEFSTGKPMTSADVVFSIDQARKAAAGLGVHRRRHLRRQGRRPRQGDHHHQVPVGAAGGRHRPVRQRHRAQGLRRRDEGPVLPAPGRHRPLHVGLLAQAVGAEAGQEPALLGEGQALPEQRHLERRR